MREMAARLRRRAPTLPEADRVFFLCHAEDLEREAAELERRSTP